MAPHAQFLLARNHREGIAYFPQDWEEDKTGHLLSMGECQEKCDADIACEQAVYRLQPQIECFLGVESMAQNHGSNMTEGFANYGDLTEEKCYAKRGFTFQSPRSGRLKLGYCGDTLFTEGWQIGGTTVNCDTVDQAAKEKHQCSYWPSSFKLSREGCWARCDANPYCTQAVHTKRTMANGDVNDFDYECRIGTHEMSLANFQASSSWASQCIGSDDCTGQVDATYVKTIYNPS